MLCWLTSCPGLTILPVQAWHHLHMNRVSTLKVQKLSKKLRCSKNKSFAPPREPSRTHTVCALRTQTRAQRHRDAHGPTHARRSTLGPTQIPCCLSSQVPRIFLGNRRMTNLGTLKPSKQMSERAHTDAHAHTHTVAGTGDQSIFLVMAS